MADKVKQELLLTPEERDTIRKNWCKGEVRLFDDLIKKSNDAQLAKAEPLIRKDEREKILTLLEKEYPAITTWPCWQALKKGD